MTGLYYAGVYETLEIEDLRLMDEKDLRG